MECVVQGIIETRHVEALEILLQGLCGVAKQRVRVHELCLKSGPNMISSEVRVLCDLAQPTPAWSVRHISGAMRGSGADQLSVLVRTVTESKVSNSVLRFFYAIGYKLDHEVLKTGFAFKFESRGAHLTVSVTSVRQLLLIIMLLSLLPSPHFLSISLRFCICRNRGYLRVSCQLLQQLRPLSCPVRQARPSYNSFSAFLFIPFFVKLCFCT